MPYEIIVHDLDGYIEVRHSGEVTVAEAYVSREEGSALMRENGLVKVLVDLRNAVVLGSVAEIFSFHETEPEAFPKGTQFALVSAPSAWPLKIADFAEAVSVTRGLDKRSFTSRDEALAWLCGSTPAEGKEGP